MTPPLLEAIESAAEVLELLAPRRLDRGLPEERIRCPTKTGSEPFIHHASEPVDARAA